ncbi:hypothetical protein [Microvirga subterranea]|uniref:hypothetical protein n=1 Tax=Microvirga subterranea TaxID=186651 RepID=UPI0011C078A0|nr:hypothetical protein [Microvirga subterranea]
MSERCIGCGAEFDPIDGPVHAYGLPHAGDPGVMFIQRWPEALTTRWFKPKILLASPGHLHMVDDAVVY